MITGVNISRYNYENIDFQGMLERILELPGDFRVRISSIEPDGFNEDFPRVFEHPKVAPHLHLCLQSGSDSILLKMRRMYNTASFMKIIENFRKTIPDFNFTTDIIVGFPGETEEDFQKTLTIADEAAFSHIHTFRYSIRNGTRAARMVDQVPDKIKAERSEIVRKLSAENEFKYFRKMLGKTQRLLIENPDYNGYAKGYGEHYIPLSIPSEGYERNQFKNVTLENIHNTDNPFIMSYII